VSLLEGLGEKGGHCSEVLSVAGFFALPSRFLLVWRFILRVKEASFLLQDPLLFNNPGITVIVP